MNKSELGRFLSLDSRATRRNVLRGLIYAGAGIMTESSVQRKAARLSPQDDQRLTKTAMMGFSVAFLAWLGNIIDDYSRTT